MPPIANLRSDVIAAYRRVQRRESGSLCTGGTDGREGRSAVAGGEGGTRLFPKVCPCLAASIGCGPRSSVTSDVDESRAASPAGSGRGVWAPVGGYQALAGGSRSHAGRFFSAAASIGSAGLPKSTAVLCRPPPPFGRDVRGEKSRVGQRAARNVTQTQAMRPSARISRK